MVTLLGTKEDGRVSTTINHTSHSGTSPSPHHHPSSLLLSPPQSTILSPSCLIRLVCLCLSLLPSFSCLSTLIYTPSPFPLPFPPSLLFSPLLFRAKLPPVGGEERGPPSPPGEGIRSWRSCYGVYSSWTIWVCGREEEKRGEERGRERERINVSIRPGQYMAGGITSDDFGIFSFLSLSLPVVPLSLSLSPLPLVSPSLLLLIISLIFRISIPQFDCS